MRTKGLYKLKTKNKQTYQPPNNKKTPTPQENSSTNIQYCTLKQCLLKNLHIPFFFFTWSAEAEKSLFHLAQLSCELFLNTVLSCTWWSNTWSSPGKKSPSNCQCYPQLQILLRRVSCLTPVRNKQFQKGWTGPRSLPASSLQKKAEQTPHSPHLHLGHFSLLLHTQYFIEYQGNWNK